MRALLALATLAALVLAGCTGTPPPSPSSPGGGAGGGGSYAPGNATHVLMNTSMGDIRLLVHTDTQPRTAGNFINLTKAGYFDGQRFHRVIGPAKQPPSGFMDQAGDPLSKDKSQEAAWGTGGPACSLNPSYPCDSRGHYSIDDEFACKDGTRSNTWTGAGGDPCASHGGSLYDFSQPGVLAMANTGQPHSGGSQFFITMASATFLNGGYPIFGQTEDAQSLAVVKAIGAVPTDSQDRPIQDVLINKVTVVG